jgi:hypothetical protein
VSISRRVFLTWAASAFPAGAIVRRAHLAAITDLSTSSAPNTTLRAVGEVVLPSELGTVGVTRAVTSFVSWMKGYREHAELTHGYGTSRIRYTGPTPATRWTSQLDALDSAARKQFGAAFAALDVAKRAQLIRSALAGAKLDRLPGVSDANHAAVALIAHFYASPAATDLCYNAAIGREQCRPLAQSSRQPLPLAPLGTT